MLSGERGQALVLVAASMVTLFGFLGFVVDVGRVLAARRQLQASSDMAASAGALGIITTTGNTNAAALATARTYGAETGQKNAAANLTGVTLTASVECTNAIAQALTGVNCTSSTQPPTTMVVTQTATINTWFARLVGRNSFSLSATAKAGAKAGGLPPLDIQIVVDTTASMAGTDINNVKAGIRTMLTQLWPCPAGQTCSSTNAIDNVGLSIFPGIQSTVVGREYDTTQNLTSSNVVAYNASPRYEIIALTNNYKTSPTSALVTNVNLYYASAANPGGLETPGGVGSYFAGAITDAQTKLVANGRASARNVIIFLSDGDAGASSSRVGASNYNNQCTQAVTAARNAAAATSPNDSWVYSIAYGTSSTGGCSTDTGASAISACTTMRNIASSKGLNNDAQKFYSNSSTNCPSAAHPSITDLSSIFTSIARDLQNTRLIE